MTINFKAPEIKELQPRLLVLGVGGAGGNAINEMIDNKRKNIQPTEMRSQLNKDSILFKLKKALNTKSNFTFLEFLINSMKLKKYFK